MTAAERIDAEKTALYSLRQRFVALRSFEEELEKITRGKEFIVVNDNLWHAMLDARDMLVVHFASWAKSTYSEGGFWGQIQAHHSNEFYVKAAKARGGGDSLDAILAKSRREHMERVFPEAAKNGKVRPRDVGALKDAFVALVTPVVDDRNVYRAHQYESGKPATAKVLRNAEVGDALKAVEALWNDMEILCANASTDYHDHLALASPVGSAEDLVDQLLIGSISLIHDEFSAVPSRPGDTGDWHWLRRERFYEQLHATHDSAGAVGCFNRASSSP